MATIYVQQAEFSKASQLADEAADIWSKMGRTNNLEVVRQFIAKLKGDIPKPSSFQEALSAAFMAFATVENPQAMQAVVNRHEVLKDPEFIQTIEEIISEQVPSQEMPAFQQRLSWLKRIAIS